MMQHSIDEREHEREISEINCEEGKTCLGFKFD